MGNGGCRGDGAVRGSDSVEIEFCLSPRVDDPTEIHGSAMLRRSKPPASPRLPGNAIDSLLWLAEPNGVGRTIWIWL